MITIFFAVPVPVLARCRHEAKSRRKSQLQPPKPWQVDFTNPAASAVEALRQGDNLRLAQAVLAWSKARYLTASDEQVLSRFNAVFEWMYQVQASPEIGLRARSVAMTSWIGCAIPLFRTQILAAVGGIEKISCQIVFLIYADAICSSCRVVLL